MLRVRIQQDVGEGAMINFRSGRRVLFTAEQPEQCVTTEDWAEKPNLLKVVGSCEEPSGAIVASRDCDDCGEYSAPLVRAVVVGHSERPKLLIGLGTGKLYGHRQNGDTLLIRALEAKHDARFRLV